MQIYQVGGAVRDALLGLPVHDHDYVVVGATTEEMIERGFIPVGKDFPVFLHPETKEEYALARTERKTAPGYKGFVIHADPDVTLEEDLMRRDLTINAMAKDDDGHIIDPYGGQKDLQQRLFRHVSDAFNEDPVRILRVARFAARFTEFRVADETQLLMQDMVTQGETTALVAERVWQEIARGLMEKQPSRMIAVLAECGLLTQLLPEIAHHIETADQPIYYLLLDQAQTVLPELTMRFAVLCHVLRQDAYPACADTTLIDAVAHRLKVPKECHELAVMVAREYQLILHASSLSAEALVQFVTRCDGLRKPKRYQDMLDVMAFLMKERLQNIEGIAASVFLGQALSVIQSIDAGKIAQAYAHTPQQIPEMIYQARVAAMASHLQQH